ncbi:MAG TPA: Wzz/FepE/Etk N-terminal domain-containing protein [Candidatus Sumerlaeota bacterium]|nr:Wzz/FepE/Etk N-terminal domain-containing protein [Candidatus Sumerlaeota bacterium]HOR28650.1 Wzz/FepE/Etk N-terminal domain-containing protein [Candidatus Sumerlaeota bacterium]HPK02280.1 Wzz/FepE/Etk N-terminal domain-containing protein [Candidatus Sumerlaeota bacterium]
MSRPSFDLSRMLLVLRTRKRYWIPLTLGAILAVNLLTLVMPKKYESVAKVRVYEPRVQVITTQAKDMLTVDDRLETISEEITSYNFLEQIAAKSTVNLTGALNPNSREYEKVVTRLSKDVKVYTGDELFEIHYKAPTPNQAYHVVNEILEEYLARTSEFYGSRTRRIVELTEQQLAEAMREREKIQERIKEYKEEHPNEIPEAAQAHMAQLANLRSNRQLAIQALEGERNAVQLALAKLKNTPEETVSKTTVEKSREVLQIRSEIRMLEMQVELKLKDFREEHPSVVALRDQIAVLERQLEGLEAAPIEQVETSPNPEFQTLKEEIMRSELEIQKLQTQIAQQDREIARLESYMKQLPVNELELSKLESELQNADDLVKEYSESLSEARRIAEVDQSGQGPSFEVIDRPRQSNKPVSPNPVKYGALSLVLGFGAGGLFIYLVALLDSAVRTMEEARQVLRMPILGVVQTIQHPSGPLYPAPRRKFAPMRKAATFLVLLIGVGWAMLAVSLFVSMAPGDDPVSRLFGGM